MRLTRFFRNYGNCCQPSLAVARGFTVLELLVTSALGLLILALAINATLTNRSTLGKDQIRVQLGQNLRGAMDIIGTDLRVGGENLSSGFPALEVSAGSGTTPDTLYVRRNLLDETLPVCVAITAGSATATIVVANSSTAAGCVYASRTHDFNSWKSYRTAKGGTVNAYIFDTVTKKGEFFKYTGESDSGSVYSLTRQSGTWTNSYSYTSGSSPSSWLYILEEWQYRVENALLQVVQNRDTANALNVMFGVTNFQVLMLMQDGTTMTSFASTDSWPDIKEVQVDLTATDRYRNDTLTATLTGKYFPRNILSN